MPKILVVDDDPLARRILESRLSARGLESVFAFDAISAVRAARVEQPDLILLDIGLPAGDGFVVMDRLAAMPALAHVPIVVLTASDAPAARERALQAGARDFFEKAGSQEELVSRIAELVGA